MRHSRLLSQAIAVMLGSLMGVALPSAAAIKASNCSAEMHRLGASLLADAGRDWRSLMRHHTTFAACDDGELAAGYSQAVVDLFANRWEQFPLFMRLAQRQPGFQQWAVQHIDSSVESRDLQRILRNTSKCRGSAAARLTCRNIRREAQRALTEL